MKQKWWKEAVVYQIYPRSFMDSNGDGIGDIQGVISKLDYLQGLGIDVIWICPIYCSPNDDNGYDISDYKAIMPEFGSMADFDELLNEVHNRGMKLIMDLVINHTSDEHPWFIESKSSKDNPYRDYYIWHPGKDGKEPNNWASIFEGSAWEFDTQTEEYYMHIFSRKQPDLNWENPKVRKDVYEMINWWLDKGIDGFRIDAISHIKKAPGFPDVQNPDKKRYAPSLEGHRNQGGIQYFLEELKNETFNKYDIMTVGEANGVTVEEAEQWVGEEEEGKFNMIFQFEHNDLWQKGKNNGLDIHELKTVFTKWQTGLHDLGWNALFLENHDLPRSVSVWGNDQEFHSQSSKCLATLYFLMQGTPFIYQGQEIGMTNVQFSSIEDYNDVAIKNLYESEMNEGKPHEEVMEVIWKSGRDNSRTPMQWSNRRNAGFSEEVPWLKLNPNFKEINVEQSIDDRHSIYHYYKNLIQLRKDHPVLIYGDYELILPLHDQIFSYTRSLGNERILVITNLFSEEAEFFLPDELSHKHSELLISNYWVDPSKEVARLKLKPFEARVYRLSNS